MNSCKHAGQPPAVRASWPLAALVAALAFLVLPSRAAFALSFVVNTTADDPTIALQCSGAPGDCSLRGAITRANLSAGTDVISFDPAVFNPGTVPIDTPLPALTGGGDTIDATTATVTIDSTAEFGSTAVFNCVVVSSAGNTVKGLRVTDCATAIAVNLNVSDNNVIGPSNVLYDNGTGVGISASDASGNSVLGNKIGTTADGSAAHPDGGNDQGVTLLGVNTTVGGTTAADRNVVSGNGGGVTINSSAQANTVIIGNYIGTSANGLVDLGNQNGVSILNGSNNTIGGTGPGEANLISGNANVNLWIQNGAGNTVAGNTIGPDAGGGGALTNGTGVLVTAPSTNNTIGPANVISDNGFGVSITVNATGNTVRGNLIGTQPNGTSALPNTSDGVRIDGSGGSNTSGNVVGGTNPSDGNVIAFNGSDGVEVRGASAVNNSVRGNSIHSNTAKGIENVVGGNIELAPPVISAVGSASGTTCASCFVDVFSDASDEGSLFHGSTIADASGIWTYFGPVSGPNVTATATDPNGNTSEFSVVPMPCGDFDLDTVNNCADVDDDNDGYDDGAEAGIPLCENATNDDSFDSETLFFVNDGCPAIGVAEVNCGGNLDNDSDGYPNDGCPKDGSYSEAQFKIGTGSLDQCGNNGWPSDLFDSGLSANKLDVQDIVSFVSPTRHLDKSPPNTDYSARWDLSPGPAPFTNWINIVDITTTINAVTGNPPMFGDTRAFGKTCPFPP